MNAHGYPSRLYWYIAAVLGVALPVAAGAVVGVALDRPDVSTGVGVILFFGLALLADMKPVPLDVENERVVSLAFVFVVSSQILFGWEYAVLSAILGVLVSQMVERRPLVRSVFNAAVYGLAAFASAIVFCSASRRARDDHLRLAGGAAYVIVNVVLVCGALAILSGQRLPLTRENLGYLARPRDHGLPRRSSGASPGRLTRGSQLLAGPFTLTLTSAPRLHLRRRATPH
jgi:hypothetical protein